MNTHTDCLTTWLLSKKYSILDFPCRSAKKVQNWIWGGINNFIFYPLFVDTKMAGTSWKDLVLALLIAVLFTRCAVLHFLQSKRNLFYNHVLFTTVIQQQHRTIESGTQSFLNLLKFWKRSAIPVTWVGAITWLALEVETSGATSTGKGGDVFSITTVWHGMEINHIQKNHLKAFKKPQPLKNSHMILNKPGTMEILICSFCFDVE